jgi:hypothetical protein
LLWYPNVKSYCLVLPEYCLVSHTHPVAAGLGIAAVGVRGIKMLTLAGSHTGIGARAKYREGLARPALTARAQTTITIRVAFSIIFLHTRGIACGLLYLAKVLLCGLIRERLGYFRGAAEAQAE